MTRSLAIQAGLVVGVFCAALLLPFGSALWLWLWREANSQMEVPRWRLVLTT